MAEPVPGRGVKKSSLLSKAAAVAVLSGAMAAGIIVGKTCLDGQVRAPAAASVEIARKGDAFEKAEPLSEARMGKDAGTLPAEMGKENAPRMPNVPAKEEAAPPATPLVPIFEKETIADGEKTACAEKEKKKGKKHRFRCNRKCLREARERFALPTVEHTVIIRNNGPLKGRKFTFESVDPSKIKPSGEQFSCEKTAAALESIYLQERRANAWKSAKERKAQE